MKFGDYLKHYFSFPGILIFILVSFCIVLFIHGILLVIARRRTTGEHRDADYQMDSFLEHYNRLMEEYYESMFSSSLILFFIGIYFLISYRYFEIPASYYEFWQKYEDYILLVFILVSIILNNMIDHLFVPLTKLNQETRGIIRMASMIYMLIIFLFIKFIYQDNNYDTIIGYFITLVIGRFIYFDASIREILHSAKKMKEVWPAVCSVLISSALLALVGFGTGYLLKSNGVVLSLFIAHFFCILEIFGLSKTQLFENVAKKIAKKENTRLEKQKEIR